MPQDCVRPRVIHRDMHFDFDGVDVTNWHARGKHVSLFLAALSPFFPEGERFFIRSVRYYSEQIHDPALKADVQGFIGQEAMHGREHQAYNAALDQAGLPAQAVENFVIRDLKLTEKVFSPKAKLGITIALEHLTAIMANVLLRDPRTLSSQDEKIPALWRWHAIEETEHKAVAFDVYKQIAPGWSGYFLRIAMMLLCSFFFALETFTVHTIFCWRAGCFWNLRGWMRAWWFLWGSPGVLRQTVVPWLAYFRPGFHPWQDDNRFLIDRWKAEQSTAIL